MIKRERGSLTYYTFSSLDRFPELRHAVFPAKGPDGGSLTLAFGSAPHDRVLENLRLAEEILGLGPAAFVNQAHGRESLVLEDGSQYAPRSPEEALPGYDAMVSGPGRSLLVKLADCQGVILWDPSTKTAAAVHSGWRGSAQNVLGSAVEAMRASRGAAPSETHAAISPSIGPCCMEFKDWRELLPEGARRFVRGNAHVDFWAMSVEQLKRAGLREENIELSGVCTRCQEGFFSHRRGDSGRFGVMCGVSANA